jgi:hypothetical protein
VPERLPGLRVLWSVDRQVVRTAARIGTALTTSAIPPIGGAAGGPAERGTSPSSADRRRASWLLERTLDYLSAAARPARRQVPGPLDGPRLDRVLRGAKDPDAAGAVLDRSQDVDRGPVEQVSGEEIQRQDPLRLGPPELRNSGTPASPAHLGAAPG